MSYNYCHIITIKSGMHRNHANCMNLPSGVVYTKSKQHMNPHPASFCVNLFQCGSDDARMDDGLL